MLTTPDELATCNKRDVDYWTVIRPQAKYLGDIRVSYLAEDTDELRMCKGTGKEGGVDLNRTPGKVFRRNSLQPRLHSFR